MLDPTILLDLRAPTPPSRPETVIERQHLPPKLDAAKRLADGMVSAYEANVAGWIDANLKNRMKIEIAAPIRDATESELEELARIIEDVEYDAERRAVDLKRFAKKATRDAKHWFSVDAALGAISRSLSDRLIAADERGIEALLDHALHLRAFRAERNPEAREGPTFDAAADLGRHLRQAMAT